MIGSTYNVAKDVLRTLPRIAKWLFFEEEDAVMWMFLVLVLSVTANLTAYSLLKTTPVEEYAGTALVFLSPVLTLLIYRSFLRIPEAVDESEVKHRATIETVKKLGKLRDTVRLKNGWLVGIYEINNSFYVIPLEDAPISEWRKFEKLFRDLRVQKEAFNLEETRKLLTENF